MTGLILAQALLLGSAALFAYGIVIWLAFHLFVLGYEEPTLRRTYAQAYDDYCRFVPRWLPRFRPWAPPAP